MMAFIVDAQFITEKLSKQQHLILGKRKTSMRKCSGKITQLKLTHSDYSHTFQEKQRPGNVISLLASMSVYFQGPRR